MGCLRASVCVVAAIASVSSWSCSLVSGVDRLQKVQCLSACDAGLDAAPMVDAAGEDATGVDDTGGPNTGDSGAGAGAYRAAVLADAPIGYWRLGDLAGTTTCHDESGHGHDGTIVGVVFFGAPGALAHDTNTAARFDGTSTIDVGTTFTLSGSAPFSWEIWVNPTTLDPSYRPFLSSMTFDTQGNPVDGSYMVAYSLANQTFGFERFHGGTAVIALDTAALRVNVWTYIVATSDAAGHGIVYVNGAAVITDTNVGAVPAYAASTILGQLLNGELDEVAIYDHALPAAAVLAHWNAAHAASP